MGTRHALSRTHTHTQTHWQRSFGRGHALIRSDHCWLFPEKTLLALPPVWRQTHTRAEVLHPGAALRVAEVHRRVSRV